MSNKKKETRIIWIYPKLKQKKKSQKDQETKLNLIKPKTQPMKNI